MLNEIYANIMLYCALLKLAIGNNLLPFFSVKFSPL